MNIGAGGRLSILFLLGLVYVPGQLLIALLWLLPIVWFKTSTRFRHGLMVGWIVGLVAAAVAFCLG